MTFLIIEYVGSQNIAKVLLNSHEPSFPKKIVTISYKNQNNMFDQW